MNTLDLTPHADDHTGDAANDSTTGPSCGFTDVELLVATTVARVTSRVQPEFVNIVLDLSATGAIVSGDPTTLAFALAGILGAMLRDAEDGRTEETFHVVVTERDRLVRISIAGPDVPPLRMLRALSGDGTLPQADRTVLHCRHLVEQLGGSLALGACAGELAIELVLPAAPNGRILRVLPPPRVRNEPLSPPACSLAS